MSPTPTSVSPSPSLSDETTLALTLDCLLEHLPLKTEGSYSLATLYSVLLRAASHQDTIEHTCQILEHVPSSNGVRYHLNQLTDMAALERQMNAALQQRLPEDIVNHRHRLAIDLHLIPYYGVPSQSEQPYLYHAKAKAGTTTFFAYGTIYVIRCHQRVTLAIHGIPPGETLVATLTILLAALSPLRVKIERLYLDRGFYSIPVMRWLQALRVPFILPAIIRGKRGGTRALCQGRCSYLSPYTLHSADYGSLTVQIAVVCRYHQGKRRRHGVHYLLFVVYRVRVALHQLPRHYRHRFGIETSYRLKNQCRIRTTTKRPQVRFFFVALAFLLVNLWIWLLWTHLSRSRRGYRQVYQRRFPLNTMLEFLSHAVERRFPLIHTISLPPPT
ncbi:MAG: transposase [Cyanobacteria bacterium]|nr:transposase [Cyanobacteriota bacterium]